MPAHTSEHTTFCGMGALVACIATNSTLGSDKDRQLPADADSEIVYYDAPDDQGRLSGGRILLPLARVDGTAAVPTAGFTTILDNGPPSNRIDIVYVGDGYLASQLDTYAAHVEVALAAHLSEEPFATYATLFNVHRVDVVSNESGVDHDPVFPTWRDTALDMEFWCSGIERLLCVSVTKAYQFANAAPDVDHVLAVANSTKYGGAGYTISDLATFSGGNFWGPEIALHEIGHSLGNLADEYDYGDGANYIGPERPERNVSILDADEMNQQGTKWALWLGDPGIGFGGLVDTYEGAYYHQFGINRPTTNSKMRTLGHPLNLPSVEGMVIEIFRIVNPIDDATPNDQPLNGTELVVVDPVDPVDHALDVQWYLDGEPIEGATQTTLDLLGLDLSNGQYALEVIVVDNTELVRDENARAAFMTDARNWTVIVDARQGILDDFNAFRGFYDSGDLDSLLESDDNDLCYNPGITLLQTEAPVTLDFFGTLPDDSPATLDVTIESSANTVGLELTFLFWNFNTESWDVVGTDSQSLNADTARTFAGNPADHVELGTGEVRTRYEVRQVGIVFLFPWSDCVDHVFWTITN